jgi:hypothetical protein
VGFLDPLVFDHPIRRALFPLSFAADDGQCGEKRTATAMTVYFISLETTQAASISFFSMSISQSPRRFPVKRPMPSKR